MSIFEDQNVTNVDSLIEKGKRFENACILAEFNLKCDSTIKLIPTANQSEQFCSESFPQKFNVYKKLAKRVQREGDILSISPDLLPTDLLSRLEYLREKAELNEAVNKPDEIPFTKKLLPQLLKKHLKNVISQTEKCIEISKNNNKREKLILEKLKKQQKLENYWIKDLREQITTLNQKTESVKIDIKTTKLTKKLENVNTLLEDLIQNMRHFMTKYYPKLSLQEQEAFNRKRNINTPIRGDLKSLMRIFQILITKHSDRDDPYVTLNVTYWTPYIELLYKAGVIEFNPDTARQICMKKFYS